MLNDASSACVNSTAVKGLQYQQRLKCSQVSWRNRKKMAWQISMDLNYEVKNKEWKHKTRWHTNYICSWLISASLPFTEGTIWSFKFLHAWWALGYSPGWCSQIFAIPPGQDRMQVITSDWHHFLCPEWPCMTTLCLITPAKKLMYITSPVQLTVISAEAWIIHQNSEQMTRGFFYF